MSRAVMQQALDALEYCIREAGPCEHECGVCVCTEIKAANALREELAKPYQGWMPMETAPKFSDEIDIWSCGCRTPECVFGKPTYGKELGWIYQSHRDSDGPVYELVRNPTHWMPLPKAPVVAP